jgi:hypothetical protein
VTRAHLHQLALCTSLALLLLAGCIGIPGPVEPQLGATFAGPLRVNHGRGNATAGGGELELTLTGDGAAIASARYSLLNVWCSNDAGTITFETSRWVRTLTPVQPAPVANGRFIFNLGDLVMSGQFIASTTATATVSISTVESVGLGASLHCDFGSWSWSGTAQ